MDWQRNGGEETRRKVRGGTRQAMKEQIKWKKRNREEKKNCEC